MDIVVIGGGMAGARLAHQLGRLTRVPGGRLPARVAAVGGPPAAAPETGPVSVTVLGEEPHPPYNRVLLAEVLAGRYRPELIALPAAGVRRARAMWVDRDERVVRCDDGSALRYDRLVLATGSNPVLPPLRGLAGEGGSGLPAGVHAFRTMEDCLALSAAVRPGVRAVVVGGGLLGVSAAQALAARGAQVMIAQQGEHLMERHLDRPAAALLRSHLEAQGVEVHTECRVRGLLTAPGPAPAGRGVRAVELADGYCLGADLVVLACGVRPRVGLAQAAGIDVAKGVVVDDQLRTSDPAVFAIGDCAQHAGTVYGLAGAAGDQADVLARVLAREAGLAPGGEPEPVYSGTRALTRLTLRPAPGAAGGPGAAALDLAAFGDPVPLPGDDVLRLADATRGAYRQVVVRGDRLVGGVLLGDLAAVGTVARTWEGDEPLPSAPLLHLLTDDGGF